MLCLNQESVPHGAGHPAMMNLYLGYSLGDGEGKLLGWGKFGPGTGVTIKLLSLVGFLLPPLIWGVAGI